MKITNPRSSFGNTDLPDKFAEKVHSPPNQTIAAPKHPGYASMLTKKRCLLMSSGIAAGVDVVQLALGGEGKYR